MNTRATRLAAVVAVLLLAAWAAGGGLEGTMDTARAQPVSVLSDADPELSDIGRLEGTPIIYVEFSGGGRCIVSDNGAGDVDCDW